MFGDLHIYVNRKENKVLLALSRVFIVIISRASTILQFALVMTCSLLYFRTKNLEPMQINMTNIIINQTTNESTFNTTSSVKKYSHWLQLHIVRIKKGRITKPWPGSKKTTLYLECLIYDRLIR